MQLGLTEEQELLQQSFADLFAAESSPDRVRAAEGAGFDPALWASLVQTGAIGIRVPESRGGSGGGLYDAAILAEQAGRALASVPLVESICTAGLLGRLDGAASVLQEALEGDCIVTLALRSADRSPEQLLSGGSVADAVLALDASRLMQQLTWEKRVLLIFSPHDRQADYRRQVELIGAVEQGLRERDLTVIEVFADHGVTIDGRSVASGGSSLL